LGDFIQKNNTLNVRDGIMFYPTKQQELGMEFYMSQDKSYYDSKSLLNQYDPALSISSNSYSKSDAKTIQWFTTFNYTFKTDTLGSYLKFIGDIGNNHLNRSNNVNTIYLLGSNIDNQYVYTSEGRSDYYTVQLDWRLKRKTGWTWQSGIKFNSIQRNNQLTTEYMDHSVWLTDSSENENFINREHILAGYFSVDKKINQKHLLKLGLRIESTFVNGVNKLTNEPLKKTYTSLFPKFYYSLEVNPNKSIFLSYNRSIHRPSFRDLNPFVIKQNDFLYQLGNPNLNPEYSQKMETGYQMKKHSLSLYGILTKDLIQAIYYVEEGINYCKPVNYGNEQCYGMDYTYNSNITNWLDTNISSGIYYYSFHFSNLHASRFSFYNDIYTHIKLSKTLSFELFNSYINKSQFRNILGAEQYQMDVTIKKTCFHDKATIKLVVNDVFNTHHDKNISTFESFNFDFYQKRFSRSMMLYFQYTINNKRPLNSNSVNSENESRQRL
jgi:hypothetical protein